MSHFVCQGPLKLYLGSFLSYQSPKFQCKLKNPTDLVQSASRLTQDFTATAPHKAASRRSGAHFAEGFVQGGKQGKETDKFTFASEVNGKYPCFAEHDSLLKKCSQAA